MGELADQIINGESCELCLMPFKDPKKPNTAYEHGYPVVCWDCWSGLTAKEKKQHQRAQVPTSIHNKLKINK